MNVIDAIKSRRSIRKFDSSKDVSDDQIEILLESARWAPSAGNLQSWYFYIIRDKSIRRKLALAALGQVFITQAPVIIVSCADQKRSGTRYGNRGKTLYSIQDATIATHNIWLTVTELGLGAAWVGAFSQNSVRRILKIPENLQPIVIMPIGYPLVQPRSTARRKLQDIYTSVT